MITYFFYERYLQALEDWDPTPDYPFDDYKIPPDFDEWITEELDSIGLY